MWCSRSEPGVLSSVEVRGWSLGSGLGGVWAGGLPRLPLGPGSAEPSMATLTQSLRRPSRAAWRPGPSLGEMVGRVSPWMSSSPISSVRLCHDRDQRPARPGGTRAPPGRDRRRRRPLDLLLPAQAQTCVCSPPTREERDPPRGLGVDLGQRALPWLSTSRPASFDGRCGRDRRPRPLTPHQPALAAGGPSPQKP